jgi:hypothetical protein
MLAVMAFHGDGYGMQGERGGEATRRQFGEGKRLRRWRRAWEATAAGCLLKEEDGVASWACWAKRPNGPASLLGWHGKEIRERWVGCICGLG